MSYDILYRARFIKTSKGLIPLIEIGSNNVWVSNKKRARDWWNWQGKGEVTAEEILADVEKIRTDTIESNKDREDKYKDESFGWFTSIRLYGKYDTTYQDFRSFFTRAIKNAKTVEEWKEAGVTFSHRLSFGAKDRTKSPYHAVNSETDLVLNDEDIVLTSYGEPRKNFRGYKFEQKQDFSFVIQINGHYYYKALRYGYSHTPYSEAGKRFQTYKKAEAALARINKRITVIGATIEKIDRPFTAKVYT